MGWTRYVPEGHDESFLQEPRRGRGTGILVIFCRPCRGGHRVGVWSGGWRHRL